MGEVPLGRGSSSAAPEDGEHRGAAAKLCCCQTLLLRWGSGSSNTPVLGSVGCCVGAWCVLASKRLSVCLTQLPAGDRYLPGPDSGGHVPRAPWPLNHVRCLWPGWGLARWLRPSLLPGFSLTCSACGRGWGLLTLPGCWFRAGLGCALSPRQHRGLQGGRLVIPVPTGTAEDPGTH